MTTEKPRTLTDEQLSRLLTLYATSVEWSGEQWDACGGPDPDGRDEPWIGAPNMEEPGNSTIVALDVAPADLDLIVAMRAALPSLLAEVRASRAASRASPEEGWAPDDLEIERLLDAVLDASYACEQTEGDRTKERRVFEAARWNLLQGVARAKQAALAPFIALRRASPEEGRLREALTGIADFCAQEVVTSGPPQTAESVKALVEDLVTHIGDMARAALRSPPAPSEDPGCVSDHTGLAPGEECGYCAETNPLLAAPPVEPCGQVKRMGNCGDVHFARQPGPGDEDVCPDAPICTAAWCAAKERFRAPSPSTTGGAGR